MIAEALIVVIVIYAALAIGAWVDRRRQLKRLEDWANEGRSPWWL